MAKKEVEAKVEYEREYTVPLRAGWLKVPEYKRANKAVKTLKEFLVRHMKVYDRDLRKIKVDIDLNNELRFRGMKKPPAKIKVRAKKMDDGNVVAGLVELPKHLEFRDKRLAKGDGKKGIVKPIEGTQSKSAAEKEDKVEKKDKDKKEVKKEEKTEDKK